MSLTDMLLNIIAALACGWLFGMVVDAYDRRRDRRQVTTHRFWAVFSPGKAGYPGYPLNGRHYAFDQQHAFQIAHLRGEAFFRDDEGQLYRVTRSGFFSYLVSPMGSGE